VKLTRSLTLVPFIHGDIFFSRHIRRLFTENRYSRVFVDIPDCFTDALLPAVDELPFIAAVVASDTADPVYSELLISRRMKLHCFVDHS
jgi:hypothetical protein